MTNGESLQVVPAYGRDYRGLKDAKADWVAGKDFQIADVSSRYDGKYVSVRDVPEHTVWVRYARLQRKGRVQ